MAKNISQSSNFVFSIIHLYQYLTINSPTVCTIARAGRYRKQRIISLELAVGHPIKAPSFLAFSNEFSVCVQQSNAVPLIDIPPYYNKQVMQII